jgi:hypothetical protein
MACMKALGLCVSVFITAPFGPMTDIDGDGVVEYRTCSFFNLIPGASRKDILTYQTASQNLRGLDYQQHSCIGSD